MSAFLAVAIFVVAYVLIATEKVHRTAVALAGAGLMLATGLLSGADAFYSTESGVDWNVIFLLFGMMVIVGVLKQTGLFEYLAIWSAKRARGRPFRIMVALTVLTAVASALLDNVTTVLLIVPVTVLICDRIGAPPVPFLLAEVFASNIGGTATLVGDPPNIIIASQGGLSYADFLVHLAPFIVVLMGVFVGMCRVLFRGALVTDPDRVAELMALDEREAIRDRPLLVRALAVLAAVTVAFVLHGVLHYEPSVIALLGAGVLVALSRRDPGPFLREVEWGTLAFFMGLFVMVGGLVEAGVIDAIAQGLSSVTGGSLTTGAVLVLWASGVLSAVVDNIPYVATMAPVTDSLVGDLPGGQVLWWALALGADLGGNATVIGASANVVVVGLAQAEGHRITFWQFTRYGLVVATASMLLATPYLLVRYIVLGS
ncbi:MAG: SLC13 family permease [Carbonactinosporaceae bacterium]